jgi:2-polyprenyl-6-methoxyphenol hydroxylase-like FAD-dependent oxidoreductase
LSLAIVGAGPAGLTAAIAAAQHGLKPTVFERADVIARVGGGIVVHSNGLRVLDRLGLLDSFKPIMIPCNTLTLQLSDGHELVTDYSALPIPHNYFAVVLRHQLHTFLLAAAEKVATIHLGRHCTAIEELSDPCSAQLRFWRTSRVRYRAWGRRRSFHRTQGAAQYRDDPHSWRRVLARRQRMRERRSRSARNLGR